MSKYFFCIFLVFFSFYGCSSLTNQSIIVSNDKKYALYEGDNKNKEHKFYEQISSLDSVGEKNINIEHPNYFNFHWIENNYGTLFSIVQKDEKFGIINKNNEFIIEPIYDSISKPYNGFLIIKKDEKYGFLNSNFKVVQEPIYLDVKEFFNNISFVKFANDKWGCISSDMKVLLDGKYDEIFPFVNGYARVLNNDKWGFINQQCEVIIEPKYDYINDFYSEYTKIVLDEKVGYINKLGEEVSIPIFNYGQNFSE